MATPAQEEAVARVNMTVAKLQIEAFRTAQGRLPSSLDEAMAPSKGLRYSMTGDWYRLEATAGTTTISSEDGHAPEAILEGMSEFAQEATR